MIKVAREDGISMIVLTPHVFKMTKHGINDGRGLKARIRSFMEQSRSRGVDFFPGAEVYVHQGMITHIKEYDLTINGSNYVFIEFPIQHVPAGTKNLVYQMMLEGMMPIIGHPERNAEFLRSPESLYELVLQGALGQVTAQSITGGFGSHVRKAAESFLRHGLVHLIASDAHDAEARPPRLSEAVEMAAKYIGTERAEAMVTTVPAAILKNEQIPDLGEPQSPAKKGRLDFSSR